MLESMGRAFPSREEKRESREGEKKSQERERESRERASLVSAAIDVFSTSTLSTSTSTSTLDKNKTDPSAQQLAPEDELNWDDGTANSEYCVDRWDDVGKYQALKWLMGGLGVFGGALTLASVLDKKSSIPFAPRDYPFDSLKKELNGSKGVGPRD